MIDAHAHLVTPDTAAFPPAPIGGETLSPAALANHMTIEALLGHMDDLGVARAVAVQRAHVYGVDNAYVLHAARRFPERVAAVACIDAGAAGSGDVARELVAAGARGLRFTTATKDPADTAWFAGSEAVAVWAAAAGGNASLCLHLFRWNRDAGVAALVPLLQRFPSVPLVLDHVGNPTSEESGFGLAALASLERFAQLRVKISTINFEYVRKAGGDIAAFTAAVVARFGADRVMWGSDVAQSRGTYGQFVADAVACAAGLPAAARAAVLGETAARTYFSVTP
jgi:predicted TIM-barrel fold metal-dependent hydrolase